MQTSEGKSRAAIPRRADWAVFEAKLMAAYKRRAGLVRMGNELGIGTRQGLHQAIDTWLDRKRRPHFVDGRPMSLRATKMIEKIFDRHGANLDAVCDDLLAEFLYPTRDRVGKKTMVEIVAWMLGRPNPIPRVSRRHFYEEGTE